MLTSRAVVRCAMALPCLSGCVLPPIHSLSDLEIEPADVESAVRSAPVLTPQVFLLRGLWDVFSLGLDDLAQELNEQGIPATSISGTNWYALGEQLQAEYASGEARPLVLVGHSYGGDDAISLARYLGERGITVDLLALADSTNPPAIPANVTRCIQWYIPTKLADLAPHDFAGNPVIAAPGNERTIIENRLFTPAGAGPQARGANHFNIEEHPYLHELVILEIQNLASERPNTIDEGQD